MGRPKNPDGPKINACAMLEADLLEQLDSAARRRRLNRSQFLAAMIERGWAAFRRDGSLFDEEDDPGTGATLATSPEEPSEPKTETRQPPKKKSPIRIVGVIPGDVFDTPKKKAVVEEKPGKKK